MSTEVQQLSLIFHPEINTALRHVISEVNWSTPFAQALTSSEIDLPTASAAVIRSAASKVLPVDEVDNFVELVSEVREVTNVKEVEQLVESFFTFYKRRAVAQIMEENPDDIDNLIGGIQDLPTIINTNLKPINMGSLDIENILEDDIGGLDGLIKSSFDPVNDASVFDAYLPGQVIMWVGRPGACKSAMMMQDALFAVEEGKSVLYIALGDLMTYDIITRAMSVMTGEAYSKVITDYKRLYTDAVRDTLSNLDVICKPAKTVSAEEILELVDNGGKRYDLVIVDYDSNVKSDDTGNMYQDGGVLYDKLTEIARPENEAARVVFVACQPKIFYWDHEKVPIEAAGESARKQQNIDMMITAGLAQNSKYHCGIMHIAKCRRGTEGKEAPWKMNPNGRIEIISMEEYNRMKTFSSHKA